MSRSYKKTPYYGDRVGKFKKRNANHRVRQRLKRNPNLILQYGDYKRMCESWDLCDFGWIFSWKDYLKWELSYQSRHDCPKETIEEYYRHWYKWYKGK